VCVRAARQAHCSMACTCSILQPAPAYPADGSGWVWISFAWQSGELEQKAGACHAMCVESLPASVWQRCLLQQAPALCRGS
jgi:hypothetical protein